MLYFKNVELAKKYHVSEGSVRNWIKEAQQGKLELELFSKDDRLLVANTNRNLELIEEMISDRKKFRNNRGVKVISPKPEFYKLYNQQQIFDISSNLDIYHEIPFQYCYFNGGAELWDIYAQRLFSESSPNFLTSTIKQLQTNRGYIDDLLSKYQRVNVIDVGAGNALPVRDLLQHLLDNGKMGKYIAVDISGSMLQIAKRNIQKWFNGAIEFEEFAADINYDRFTQLSAEHVIGKEANSTINIVIALGGTFANLRSPDGAFKIIHDSMNRNDLLIYNLKLDTESARRYFDFSVGNKTSPLDAQAEMIINLLNIEESFYDAEMGFDERNHERYTRIRLKVALTMKFEFENGERTVEFNKNDTILLWRYWHQNVHQVTEQLEKNEFDILQTSVTEDKDYLLTISRVKSY